VAVLTLRTPPNGAGTFIPSPAEYTAGHAGRHGIVSLSRSAGQAWGRGAHVLHRGRRAAALLLWRSTRRARRKKAPPKPKAAASPWRRLRLASGGSLLAACSSLLRRS